MIEFGVALSVAVVTVAATIVLVFLALLFFALARVLFTLAW